MCFLSSEPGVIPEYFGGVAKEQTNKQNKNYFRELEELKGLNSPDLPGKPIGQEVSRFVREICFSTWSSQQGEDLQEIFIGTWSTRLLEWPYEPKQHFFPEKPSYR